MHFLATCDDFDAAKFERLDAILAPAGAAFGPAKRAEFLATAPMLMPTRSTGGVAERQAQLMKSLSEAFQVFNKMLLEISPTPETANQLKAILSKYPPIR